MKLRTVLATGALLLTAGALAVAYGWLGGGPSRGLRADPTDPAMVGLGERVYREHCASCHGGNLEGQPDWRSRKSDGKLPAPPHDDTGHTWHHADDVLFRMTKYGAAAVVPGYRSDMPAYGDVLTDEQIWAVLAYIKSRWPEDIRARHDVMNERAASGG